MTFKISHNRALENMGIASITKEKVIFVFLIVIFVGSIIFLSLELVPIQEDVLSLPPPDLTGYLPLSSAIHKAKQAQDLRNYILKNDDVSQILWALQGITHGFGFRTVPSAGATYPLEIFLVHSESSIFPEGCYNFVPQGHYLSQVSSSLDWNKLYLSLSSEDREAVSNVSTIFFILVNYARTTDRYGDRGIQYVHQEVGHALQNFILQLTSLNLNTRIIANFTSNTIQDFLDTTLEPLVVLPVGISGNITSTPLKLKQYYSVQTEEMTVEQAIAKRESLRDYQSGSIPLAVALDLLENCTVISHVLGNNLLLDLRVVVSEIDGLSIGSYKYILSNNSLYQLSQGDLRSNLTESVSQQSCVVTAQFDVVISIDTSWLNQQDEPSFYHACSANIICRAMMFNVGMIAQNIYLKCAAYGLGTVVIGAFSESGSAQLLEIPDSHTPVYLIPIGLTPEFFAERIGDQIPLTDLARLIGLLSYLPFYITLYLSLPIIKRRMKKKLRWLHCIVGTIPLIGVFYHFMVIHGHVQDLSGFLNLESYFNALLGLIFDLFTFPTTRYEIGMLLATLMIPLGTIAAITGILFAFKLVKQRKLAKSIHKYTIFIIIIFAIIHNLLNGTIFATMPQVFLLLNILAIDLYFLLYLSPNLIKAYRKESTSIKNGI
ncbi:MAG: SagB family peptide dehydrogenase [Candidatus Heimdallarchaeota archaeon]|nr:MAG: SagB family peptide dehydrogenase [Candidatus Heimdallarchaeota archaeon]